MVEFAVIAPVLFMLLIAICQFSYLMYAYLTLQHAVSEAARFGVTGQFFPPPEGDYPEGRSPRSYSIRKIIEDLTPGLNHDPKVLIITLTQRSADREPISIEGPEGDKGGRSFSETLIVKADYTYKFSIPPFGYEIPIHARAAMRNEYFNPPK